MDKYIFPILAFLGTEGIVYFLAGAEYTPISAVCFIIGYSLGRVIAKHTK